MERIKAGLLIPGRGEPVRDAAVLIDGGRISYAGPAAGAPAAPGAVTRSAATVLPGLWDCHGHFMGSRALDLARLPQEPTALRAARSARDLTNALNAGITSVREVGGLGVYLAQAVREGLLDGPSIYAPVPSSAPPAATATCTATRCRGCRLRPPRRDAAAGRRHRPSACARSGSSCAGAPPSSRSAPRAACCPRWTTRSTSSSPTPSCGPSSRWPGWPTGWWRRTATASPASWPRSRPGSPPSSTAPTWTTRPATRCARPARSWSRPGRIIENILANLDQVPPTRRPS